jgi:hypothetical protein
MARFAPIVAALALALVATPVTAAPKTEWDGLILVKSKRMDAVYLMPDADFREYTKVMLVPTEVAFKKNWHRDMNRDATSLDRRVSDADARRILDAAKEGFEKVFRRAYEDAGYQVVDAPGSDVIKVATAVVNLDVQGPDIMSAGRSRTYTREAGSGTLVLEVRDSLTGALLGRALDADTTGDFGMRLRNSVTNVAEFERMFADWARQSAKGLTTLKELSPVDVNGIAKR